MFNCLQKAHTNNFTKILFVVIGGNLITRDDCLEVSTHRSHARSPGRGARRHRRRPFPPGRDLLAPSVARGREARRDVGARPEDLGVDARGDPGAGSTARWALAEVSGGTETEATTGETVGCRKSEIAGLQLLLWLPWEGQGLFLQFSRFRPSLAFCAYSCASRRSNPFHPIGPYCCASEVRLGAAFLDLLLVFLGGKNSVLLPVEALGTLNWVK